MKKTLAMLLALAMLLVSFCGASADTALQDAACPEEGFATKVPAGMAAVSVPGTGLQVFTGHEGYIPYVIVHRRTGDLKFKDPVNYLNNVYREYIEDKYGDDCLGMNPAKTWEAGGKQLVGARYMFKVSGVTVVQLLLIEIRDGGDVEYTVKYLDGEDAVTMEALDAAVRYYTETDAAGGAEDGKQEAGAVVKPADVTGTLVDRNAGAYWTRIRDTDRILDGGWFTAEIYVPDYYSLGEVNALQSGDRVQVAGTVYTVDTLLPEEDGRRELRVREDFDGYIVFNRESNTACTALVNDWLASTKVAEEKIMMPLANGFSFVWMGGDEESSRVYKADDFVNLITDPDTAPALTQYNTVLQFTDGLVTLIGHTDYPEGPETY